MMQYPPSSVAFAPAIDIPVPQHSMPRSFNPLHSQAHPQLYISNPTAGPSHHHQQPPPFRFSRDFDEWDEEEDDEDTYSANSADNKGKGRLGGPRAAGACDACKQSKVKCVFPHPPFPGATPKCRRCAHGGHTCHISGRKQKPRPPSHEELLARLRERDDLIWRLLVGEGGDVRMNGAGQMNDSAHGGNTQTTTSPCSSGETLSPGILPPLPVWDRRTPKMDVERLVAQWIQEARNRIGCEEGTGGGMSRVEIARQMISDETHAEPYPAILRDKLVTPQDVDLLFRIFFDKINMFFTICDPVLHTPARVLRSSPFLFTTICATASRHHPTAPPTLYPALLAAAKHCAVLALHSSKRVETCQAYLLLGVYHPPPRSFREDRTFLWIGLAIRIASDLELHLPSPPPSGSRNRAQQEEEDRQRINRARVWLNCFCNDKSISTQVGKPSAIGKGVGPGVHLRRWWHESPWNGPHDIHVCAYAELLGVVSGFHEVVVRGAADGDGSKHLNLTLVQTYVDKIGTVGAEWTQMLAENSARRPHPATTWRDNLWPFMVSYAKLVVLSIGLQDGMRQGLRRDNPFSEQCVEAATNILIHVTETLAKLGYLRYCVEAYFVFVGFAAAFLLKILRPKFSFMMRPGREEYIISLVQRLIDLFGSDAIAIDSRHTPRLYARFLKTVLDRHAARRSPDVGRTALPTQANISAPPLMHPTYSTSAPTSNVAPNFAPPAPTQTPTPQWMYTFFGAAQPPYLDTQMEVEPPLSMNSNGDDMMLHSMAAITDPRFWEGGTMPGFAWAAAEGGAANMGGGNGMANGWVMPVEEYSA